MRWEQNCYPSSKDKLRANDSAQRRFHANKLCQPALSDSFIPIFQSQVISQNCQTFYTECSRSEDQNCQTAFCRTIYIGLVQWISPLLSVGCETLRTFIVASCLNTIEPTLRIVKILLRLIIRLSIHSCVILRRHSDLIRSLRDVLRRMLLLEGKHLLNLVWLGWTPSLILA